MPFVQENYAMDAVQRDLNLLLTQDQIDNGGLSIYTTLDPAVQNAAQDGLETQLSKIARSRRQTGRLVPHSSRLFTRSLSVTGCCRALRSAMVRFAPVKSTARGAGRREIPMGRTAEFFLVRMV